MFLTGVGKTPEQDGNEIPNWEQMLGTSVQHTAYMVMVIVEVLPQNEHIRKSRLLLAGMYQNTVLGCPRTETFRVSNRISAPPPITNHQESGNTLSPSKLRTALQLQAKAHKVCLTLKPEKPIQVPSTTVDDIKIVHHP